MIQNSRFHHSNRRFAFWLAANSLRSNPFYFFTRFKIIIFASDFTCWHWVDDLRGLNCWESSISNLFRRDETHIFNFQIFNLWIVEVSSKEASIQQSGFLYCWIHTVNQCDVPCMFMVNSCTYISSIFKRKQTRINIYF